MKSALFAAFLLSFILLAGCMAQQEQAPKPKQEKPVITPQERHVSVSLIRVPEGTVEEGEKFTMVWYVDSEPVSETGGTEAHYGIGPVSEPPALDSYPLSTPSHTGTVPGTFSADMVAGETNIYVRAHALVDGEDYWSEEGMVKVRAIPLNMTIRLTQAPSEVNANEGIYVNWTVMSNKHRRPELMELRYGRESSSAAGAAAYPNSIAVENPEVPGSFGVYMRPLRTQGILYFRVHMVVDNQDYWGEEFSVRFVQPLSYSSGA